MVWIFSSLRFSKTDLVQNKVPASNACPLPVELAQKVPKLKTVMPIFRSIFALTLLSLCFGQIASAKPESAKIISFRASAALISGQSERAAAISDEVIAGNGLKTDRYGRLSILLPNQMLLKVAEETLFLYNGLDATGVAGELKYGKVWLRGQKQITPFQIVTPTATAAIRGTEWYMEVATDGTTKVGVLDGVVEVKNSLGTIELTAREIALVEPGKPPVKLAYITPPNSVNWTLNYFGLWDKQDLLRDGGQMAQPLEDFIGAYYASHLGEAAKILQDTSANYQSAKWQAAAGFLSLISGDEANAKKRFNEAHATDPKWALPLAHLSLLSLVENDLDGAVRLAEEGCRVDPNSAVAQIALAYALKGNLHLEESYRAAQRAVALSPTFPEGLIIAAQIALEMELYSDAEKYLEQISDSSTLLDRKRTIQGYLALRKSKAKEAKRYFEEALELDPNSADARMGLGISLFRENNPSAAIESIIAATLIAPQVSSYQSYLAKAYLETGKTVEAEQVLERAKRLDPKDPTPFLYEALKQQADFQPGQAFESLRAAEERNDHRAVFRSRYLLDQDRSVLTSNLSQVYHEIGFDHTATQEAARALEFDPTSQAAHRREFFALQFDPRGYTQAASSERLLNNIFVPPTRSAVVLNEELLSPYQNTYDRPGVDTVLKGRGEYDETNKSDAREGNGNGTVAAQLDFPLAFSVDIGGAGKRTNGPNRTQQKESAFKVGETKDESASGRLFAKWQVTPDTEVFGEYRYEASRNRQRGIKLPESAAMQEGNAKGLASNAMADTSTLPQNPPTNGMNPPLSSDPEISENPMPTTPEVPVTEMPELMDNSTSAVSTDTDNDIYDVDLGLHTRFTPDTHGLLHASYHGKDNNSEISSSPIGGDESESLDESQDGHSEFSIFQGALWQRMGNHFFQLGARHYEQDASLRLLDDIAQAAARNGRPKDVNLESIFLVDQFTPIESVVATAGINIDYLSFDLLDNREDTKTEVGPSFGISWAATPDSYLRAAIIHNLAGDRNERLQQTLIAGFPWQRLTLSDPYSEEQLFHLEYETYSLAWDVRFHDPTVYLGVELETDHQSTESLMEGTERIHELLTNDTERGRFYMESLLNPQLAIGATYRIDTFDLPNDTIRHGLGFGTSYYTPWQMALKFNAEYVNLTQDGSDSKSADERGVTFVPALEGYPFHRKVRTNFRFPINTDGDYSIRFDFFCYLAS